MDAARMSFLMEVLGNENISPEEVIGRFPQKLLPGCHRARLFDRRSGLWIGQQAAWLVMPGLDPGIHVFP